jgi:hypothetical protein
VVEVLELVEDAGRPVDAETALARTHPEPDPAADVVETGGAAAAGDRLGQMASRDQLALADDLLRVRHRLLGANPRAEPVEALLLGAGQRLLGRPARSIDAELLAGGVDRMLGHQPEGRRLAAGDRDEALDAVALRVVEHGVGAADVTRVGDIVRRVQRPRSRPDPERAGLAEAGDELLALVEHLVDLSGVTSSSSGSATSTSVVPITETVRIGTMMSPSLGDLQRLTHVFTSRWFIAIMIPLPGTTDTTQPARLAICPAHAPDALITMSARISSSSPVSSSWARAPITLPSRSSRLSTRW